MFWYFVGFVVLIVGIVLLVKYLQEKTPKIFKGFLICLVTEIALLGIYIITRYILLLTVMKIVGVTTILLY